MSFCNFSGQLDKTSLMQFSIVFLAWYPLNFYSMRSHLPLFSKFPWTEFGHCNRNPCYQKLHMRLKVLPMQIWQQFSSWSHKLHIIKLLGLKLCELCFIHCCTIDKRQWTRENFTSFANVIFSYKIVLIYIHD